MELKADFETIEVDGTVNRYVNQPGAINPYLFEHMQYAGVQGMYKFENYDNPAMPAMGMLFMQKAAGRQAWMFLSATLPMPKAHFHLYPGLPVTTGWCW
jgi:hypothetical protein